MTPRPLQSIEEDLAEINAKNIRDIKRQIRMRQLREIAPWVLLLLIAGLAVAFLLIGLSL